MLGLGNFRRPNIRPLVNRPAAGPATVAATFTGSQRLRFAGDLTGLADSSRMTVAVVFRPTVVNVAQTLFEIESANGLLYRLYLNASGGLMLTALNSDFAFGTNGPRTVSGVLTAGTAYTAHVAFKTAAGAMGLRAFLNGAEPITFSSGADYYGAGGNLALATAGTGALIGGRVGNTDMLQAELASLYFVAGNTDAAYITDPTVFHSGGGRNLGADGTATGAPAPLVYMNSFHHTLENWQAGLNRGTGGNFAVTGTFG